MDWIKAIALGLSAVFGCTLFRKQHPDLRFLLSLGGGVLLLFVILSEFHPIMLTVQKLFNQTTTKTIYADVLWKALGISYLTSFAISAAEDAGEGALAQKIELAGQIALLVLALPLFEEVTELALSLLQRS